MAANSTMNLRFWKKSKNPRVHSSEERDLLVQFANCEIGLDDLLAGLGGMAEFEFAPGKRRLISHFLVSEPGIRVDLHTIRNAVIRQTSGEMSADELQRWATMLLLNDAYVWDGADEELIADQLHELSMLQCS
jgi:hypothetical protein